MPVKFAIRSRRVACAFLFLVLAVTLSTMLMLAGESTAVFPQKNTATVNSLARPAVRLSKVPL